MSLFATAETLMKAQLVMLILLLTGLGAISAEARARKTSSHVSHSHRALSHHETKHFSSHHYNTSSAHTPLGVNKTRVSEKEVGQHCTSGKATIYSDKFNGRKTSTGERFRQDGLTAASPSLPIGSKVRVTNKANGKSVTLRVNDKQPSGGGKVLDLSKAAANKLGAKGTANVTTTVLPKK